MLQLLVGLLAESGGFRSPSLTEISLRGGLVVLGTTNGSSAKSEANSDRIGEQRPETQFLCWCYPDY
ncbi:hypothetical protein [Microcoleus sp. herbarium12]|uniref:hypothetical protein n=1 Tax=Microcoleus sp. herbarium12 TaxID=3055437 RepID=UPI002FD35DF5